MKTLRRILAGIGGLLAILIIVAIVLVSRFDANEYKDEITAWVQERTGRILTIDDEIELSLFPWFAVETGGVALSDDPDFGDRSMVTVDELSARVRVWPLLKRRVEIGRVVFDGINLNLGLDAEGRGNWESLLPATDLDAPEPVTEPRTRRSFEEFAVEGIEFRNARILWQDENGEVIYLARNVALETGPVRDDDPVQVSLEFSLLDVASQAVAEISLETVASYTPDKRLTNVGLSFRVLDSREAERAAGNVSFGSITVDGDRISAAPGELTATLTRPPIGAESLRVLARLAGIDFDTANQRFVVNELETDIGGIVADWNLTGESLASDPTLNGAMAFGAVEFSDLVELLGIDMPASIDTDALGTLAGNASFRVELTPLAISVDRYEVAALDLVAEGNAALTGNRNVAAHIELPDFRPSAALLGLLSPLLPEGVELGSVGSASLNADLTLAPESDRLDIGSFEASLDTLNLGGRFEIAGLADPSLVSGSLSATGLDDRLLAALFKPWLPPELLAAELGGFRLDTGFEFTPAASLAVFEPLELTAYGVSGNGQLTVVDSDGATSLQGQVRLDSFAPRELLARFDLPVPQTSDPAVLASAEVAVSFETNASSGQFRDIVVELDDSRITGEFDVENFADPDYRFVLRADRIDVDRYLPPRAQAQTDAENGERKLGEIRFAREPLTATSLRGTASIGNLVIGGMAFEQLATDLAVGGGMLGLNNVRTRLYGGEFTGGLSIDATGEASIVQLRGAARDVTVGPILEAMLGQAHLSGTGNFELNLTGRGTTINEALHSSSGSMSASLRNGAIDGINLGHSLCSAVNSARRLPRPASAPDRTEYSEMRGTATVTNGIASTSDLYASTGYLELTARGTIRLVDQWIDTQNRARATGPIPIAGCEDLNATIARDPVPFNFTLDGVPPNLEPGYDISQLLEDAARRELRNQAQDAARDAVRRLFD